MAELNYTEFTAPQQVNPNGRAVRALNLSAGVVSLALMAGLALWGYKLLVRDVNGVPVVRAIEGPLRVAPDQPGGQAADNQGLAVNEVTGEGVAAGPAEQLVLAPPPADLAPDDQPAVTDQPNEQVAGDSNALISDQADLREDLAPMSPGDSVIEQPPVELARDNRGGVTRSPRPPARPAGLRVAQSAPSNTVQSGQPAQLVPEEIQQTVSVPQAQVSLASLPVGTRVVQLGAFDSDEVARREWSRISGRYADFFVGKQMLVQRAQSAGKTFYRLRAVGFSDLNDARRFCSVLVGGGSDCIPVTIQ